MGLTASPWNLTYPDAADRPDEITDDLYALADRMDYWLGNRWAADDARLRRRRAAKVTYDSSVRYAINNSALATVQYNNVQLDTAGMVDLQLRPDRIYFPNAPRPALYLVGGTVNGASLTQPSVPDIRVATNCQWANIGGVRYEYTMRDQNQDRGDWTKGETFQISGTILTYARNDDGAIGGDPDLFMQIEINSGVIFTVYYADMWAFWLTDIPSIPNI